MADILSLKLGALGLAADDAALEAPPSPRKTDIAVSMPGGETLNVSRSDFADFTALARHLEEKVGAGFVIKSDQADFDKVSSVTVSPHTAPESSAGAVKSDRADLEKTSSEIEVSMLGSKTTVGRSGFADFAALAKHLDDQVSGHVRIDSDDPDISKIRKVTVTKVTSPPLSVKMPGGETETFSRDDFSDLTALGRHLEAKLGAPIRLTSDHSCFTKATNLEVGLKGGGEEVFEVTTTTGASAKVTVPPLQKGVPESIASQRRAVHIRMRAENKLGPKLKVLSIDPERRVAVLEERAPKRAVGKGGKVVGMYYGRDGGYREGVPEMKKRAMRAMRGTPYDVALVPARARGDLSRYMGRRMGGRRVVMAVTGAKVTMADDMVVGPSASSRYVDAGDGVYILDRDVIGEMVPKKERREVTRRLAHQPPRRTPKYPWE